MGHLVPSVQVHVYVREPVLATWRQLKKVYFDRNLAAFCHFYLNLATFKIR